MAQKKKWTDEANFRGDRIRNPDSITTEVFDDMEEVTATNKSLEEASRAEDLNPSHWKVHPSGKVTKMAGNMIDPSEWQLGDIPEPEVLDDGEEAKVTIAYVTDAETKSGGIPYWRITLEVADNPRVKDFSFNLYKPNDEQTPKQNFNTKYRIQEFMKAFNLNMSRPFDPEVDWLGEEAWCIVSMKEDKEYGKQNQVRKWILPK